MIFYLHLSVVLLGTFGFLGLSLIRTYTSTCSKAFVLQYQWSYRGSAPYYAGTYSSTISTRQLINYIEHKHTSVREQRTHTPGHVIVHAYVRTYSCVRVHGHVYVLE
jgi:hypothetical protein